MKLHTSTRTRSLSFGSVLVLAVILAGASAGCGDDPIPPSLVSRLRILGLKPTPASPVPGSQLSLDLLWTDTRPSCEDTDDCTDGQTCESGQCRRPNDNVEMIWIVASMAAWQTEETGFTDFFGDISGEGEPTEEDCSRARTLYETCQAAGCLPFGPITVCCGDRRASSVDIAVPEMELPEETCNESSSLDFSQILQVQAQVCIGGQLDLCDVSPSSLSLGCVGEGAESVVATSRIYLSAPDTEANTAPFVDDPTWGRIADEDEEPAPDPIPWEEGSSLVVHGCQGNNCASRSCQNDLNCAADQDCIDNHCHEVLSIALGGGAQETYLRACDSATSCEEDKDCEDGFVCELSICERIENPITAYFADAGAFSPGRVVLDTTGNGRPDEERFTTSWLPPTLDPCSEEGDPCTFGTCDPRLRLCTGEVDLWVVARDGRGGQDWIERTIRVVP